MISGTFYTIGETAKLLQKNRNTIAQWIKQGKIKGRNVGNMVLIDEPTIKWLQSDDAYCRNGKHLRTEANLYRYGKRILCRPCAQKSARKAYRKAKRRKAKESNA